ncbi:MAG: 50S ribosomal protein L2 [Patescibacteria group bacterium]
MPIKIYRPTTPGRRKASVQDFSDVTTMNPTKSLLRSFKENAGRNNSGKITVRHRGGGVKRLYRMVDFRQEILDVPATVRQIEYDPNRGPRVALIEYENGVKSYILAPAGLKVGDKILSSMKAIEPITGSRMPIKHIPVGMFIHNVELLPGTGGKLVRGAGNGAQIQTIEGEYAQLKLPSGEVRLVMIDCRASLGAIGNPDYKLIRLGTAGRKRRKGWRPAVTGKAMNPVDHPHGGGEGHNPIGLKRGPKTLWGKPAMGVKTRKRDKASNKFILKRRKNNKE